MNEIMVALAKIKEQCSVEMNCANCPFYIGGRGLKTLCGVWRLVQLLDTVPSEWNLADIGDLLHE